MQRMVLGPGSTSAAVHKIVTANALVVHEIRDLQENPSENMNQISRCDMHVHSTASQLSKLGIQRSLHLPECATEPAEVYDLAKRRGMDFVTITDHDTIDGALALAHLADTFVSEELTASFRGEPQAVHILCFGITPADHEWLQAHRDDVETCAAYLTDRRIACALAHPFFAVGAPLTARHRRRLAQLFPVWETRNGSRAKELNLPAYVYIETHGGTAIGGSDDHAGIDIGATFTEGPASATPAEFLDHLRRGEVEAHGAQGSAAKWAHAAIALAIRAHGETDGEPAPNPSAVLRIIERIMSEGEVRSGRARTDLGAGDARALLQAWRESMDLGLAPAEILRALQDGELSHPDLMRRSRRIHERALRDAVAELTEAVSAGAGSLMGPAGSLFAACIPTIPYAVSSAFLGREKLRLTRADGDRPRVALVADGLGSMHGVTHAIAQIRERGVPGHDVEVIGTDADVDHRLSAVTEIEVPFYPGLRIGVPGLPAIVEALAEGRYDLVHLVSPGPAGIGAALLARALELPVVGSYHTELATYAGVRSGSAALQGLATVGLSSFYGACATVLSPSPASDERLVALGIPTERIGRWDRGVDLTRFDPALREAGRFGETVNVLYAGRLTREKGVELLADAFLAARVRDPRLHLVLAGGGPEEGVLRERLGEHATFLGWLGGEALPVAYASADAFLFASVTDTFGQVVLEAQASGLPVIAVNAGGPASLVRDGETGLLTGADPDALAAALVSVTSTPRLAARLRRAGLIAVRERSWERSLADLGRGYETTLACARRGGRGERAA
jgi:glycosyltransferase involved in cell wall biosynthesis/predicted metal-dependent phosphoesterase TrpH